VNTNCKPTKVPTPLVVDDGRLVLGCPPCRSDGMDVPYWSTLGRTKCQQSDFTWGTLIGWRKGLGRAYFSSFCLDGVAYQPGDFVVRQDRDDHGTVYEEVFRVTSSFQAMKSWVGRWDKRENEIQKRGATNIFVVFFLKYSSANENCDYSHGSKVIVI